MRDFVNRKSKLLQPSGIRKFFDIVRETEGAISLGVGEPDFVTPWPCMVYLQCHGPLSVEYGQR